jgi:hypothetical protein
MAEEPPFIVVDNQKIAPLYRVTHTRDVRDDGRDASREPFGVVDRVTISAEAREKSLRLKQHSENDSHLTPDPVKRLPAAVGRPAADSSKIPR